MNEAAIINRGRAYPEGFNHYDEGWNAFVAGKPYSGGSRSWRDGYRDAREAGATENMQ